jgi:hypothetical protein
MLRGEGASSESFAQILSTSAPWSASSMAAIDPARSWAVSITRTPSNALAMAAPDPPRA